jgi:hypothetical protein
MDGSIHIQSMQTQKIEKQFDKIVDLGFDNLVVGGCSFTYTNPSQVATTWPYYFRDLAGFKQVYSCAMPGAGNNFISQSMVWGLETKKLSPETTMVVVMWSGHDREDAIFSADAVDKNANFVYNYTDNVCNGTTGGSGREGDMTLHWWGYRDIHKYKSFESRAVENAIWKIQLKKYLDASGYKSIFVDFLDPSVPNRTANFDIVKFLPDTIKETYISIMDQMQNIYSFSLKRMLLTDDDFHVSPDGNLAWTREILIPYCKDGLYK